jgi:hypothetical protein
MTRCLTERTLVLLEAGEGAAEERAHLRACPRCAARYRALGDDLELIADALHAGPPPAAAAPPRLRWRAVGALAATVALAVGATWLWRAAPVPAPGGGGDVGALVEELSGTLFATPEAAATGEQSATDVAYETASFDDDDELALLFEGP